MDLKTGANLSGEGCSEVVGESYSLVVWHKINKQFYLFLLSLCIFVVYRTVLHKDIVTQTCGLYIRQIPIRSFFFPPLLFYLLHFLKVYVADKLRIHKLNVKDI